MRGRKEEGRERNGNLISFDFLVDFLSNIVGNSGSIDFRTVEVMHSLFSCI